MLVKIYVHPSDPTLAGHCWKSLGGKRVTTAAFMHKNSLLTIKLLYCLILHERPPTPTSFIPDL